MERLSERLDDAGELSASARAYVADQRVLITGAAGSLGAALARALAELGCAQIVLLDHADHALLDLCDELHRTHPHVRVTEALCDIRYPGRLDQWFARTQPSLVIHAAALKHVHLGERHPCECVLTNLIGVRNVARAAAKSGAARFVLVSTDKAASPVSVMGACKRLAELYLEGARQAAAGLSRPAPVFSAVRMGNIFGSQGSVVPKFQAQLREGRSVELTHPDMERFFVSMDRAVRTVLEVAALTPAAGAEVGAHALEMGDAVRIADLAREMSAAAGVAADVVITGLREGEKLSEELWDEDERCAPSSLAHVLHVTANKAGAHVGEADIDALEHLAAHRSDAQLTQRLFAVLDRALERNAPLAI